jgi:hypothetical protein
MILHRWHQRITTLRISSLGLRRVHTPDPWHFERYVRVSFHTLGPRTLLTAGPKLLTRNQSVYVHELDPIQRRQDENRPHLWPIYRARWFIQGVARGVTYFTSLASGKPSHLPAHTVWTQIIYSWWHNAGLQRYSRCRILPSEELCGLRSSPTTVRVVACTRPWWAGHLIRLVTTVTHSAFLLWNLFENVNPEDRDRT